jgi:hypothetical protein
MGTGLRRRVRGRRAQQQHPHAEGEAARQDPDAFRHIRSFSLDHFVRSYRVGQAKQAS